ncbi:MAG: DUF3592 domain-containing protein [Zetaproteobacteria bacterium]|nr:MAG: DUF3592 domain-containing protein [Zetaproteobacteria bacterium]
MTRREGGATGSRLLLFAGIFLIVTGALAIWRNHQTATWPTAPARVERMELARTPLPGICRLHIAYRYRVGRSERSSSRLWRQDPVPFVPCIRGAALLHRLQRARGLQAAFNPKRPEEAVLRPGGIGSAWLLPAAGALLLLVAARSGRPAAPSRPVQGADTAQPAPFSLRRKRPTTPILIAARLIGALFTLGFLAIFLKLVLLDQGTAPPPRETARTPTAAGRTAHQQAPRRAPTAPTTPQRKGTAATRPPLPTGGRVVAQTIEPPAARPFRPPTPSKELRAFLARIAHEPSPCAALLPKIDRRISAGGDLDALFARLQRCKWQRQSYSEEKAASLLFRFSRPDPWPEERAIRKVITAMAARLHPPAGVKVYPVPVGKAPVVNGFLSEEWNDALLFAPKGSAGRVYLKSDGRRIYLGIAVPTHPGSRGSDSVMVLLHTHLSPHFANEYFFIYQDGRPSAGYRTNLIRPSDAPEVSDWREIRKLPAAIRWKASGVVYDGGVFPFPLTATTVRGEMRMYEAAIDPQRIGIPTGHPFALGLVISAGVPDGRGSREIWPFKQDYATHGSAWEVWLTMPPPKG